MLTMDNKTFAEERAEEERLQKQMLQGDVLSSQDKKDPIKNPDIKIIPKVINREKEASYKIAEFELSKLKNDLLRIFKGSH